MRRDSGAGGDDAGDARPHVYTIGHSNHPLEKVVDLLKLHCIDVLVDVRSQPYSRYSPQFSRPGLAAAITAAGLQYLFMGRELGGRPDGAGFYDDGGRTVYSRVERSPLFLEGLARLQAGITKYTVALLCSEEDPAGCHRHLLIGHALQRQGVRVLHIRGDGSVQTEDQLGATAADARPDGQLPLFADEEIRERKSIRSVLPRERRRTSSAP